MLEGGLYEDIQFDESEQGEMKYPWSVVQSVCSFPFLLYPSPSEMFVLLFHTSILFKIFSSVNFNV